LKQQTTVDTVQKTQSDWLIPLGKASFRCLTTALKIHTQQSTKTSFT